MPIRYGNLDKNAVDENITLDDSNRGEYILKVLERHNFYRQKHGVPPLQLKDEVTKYSQTWSDELLRSGKIMSSPKENRKNYGENLYWSDAKYVHPHIPVEQWYLEANAEHYDYSLEPAGIDFVGHFTQVVWKSTKYLGVGVSATKDGGIYVVCNYEPIGNRRKKFTANVLPLGYFEKVALRKFFLSPTKMKITGILSLMLASIIMITFIDTVVAAGGGGIRPDVSGWSGAQVPSGGKAPTKPNNVSFPKKTNYPSVKKSSG